MTASPTIVTAGEARRIALNAQGLLGPRRRGGPAATLRQLGGVQLDTISVLARSHELVAYARHGAIRRAAIEEAYWGTSSTHLRVLVARGMHPSPRGLALLRHSRRRARLARGRRWHRLEDEAASCADVVARLRAEGPADGAPSWAGPRRGALVGLVRDQDRGGVAARHGSPRLPAAAGLPACLRPGRTGHPRRVGAGRAGATRSAPSAGRGGRALARRGHRG